MISVKDRRVKMPNTSGQLLPYISDENLFKAVKEVVKTAKNAISKADKEFYRNVVDPFSALFYAMTQELGKDQWVKVEKSRQMQKTLENSLGRFHQRVLGDIPGWEDLGTGKILDVVNKQKKIIAEIKNKYNTVKGSDKKGIYDRIDVLLNGDYLGYKGYYVEIIPKKPERYNIPFTPSDNETGESRPPREDIRVIDGYSFYEMASGTGNALDQLFSVLPKVLAKILGNDYVEPWGAHFKSFFDKVYYK